MGSNSIRSNLTKDDIINTIRLELSADREKKNIHIIVEGVDDTRFWNANICNNAIMYESFSGKHGISEIVDFFNNERVIGIRDTDYDVQLNNNHLFYYDGCCLELMLLSNSCSLRKAVKSISPKGIYPEESILLESLCKQLYWISAFRKYSSLEKLEIKFEGLRIANIYNNTFESIPYEVVCAELKKLNPSKDFSTATKEKLGCTLCVNSLTDYINCTQGHDAIKLLKIMYLDAATGKCPSEEEILIALICAFDIKTSTLYHTLATYCSSKGIQFFLE